MRKKLTAFILTLALTLILLPMTAWATSDANTIDLSEDNTGISYANWTYDDATGVYTVTGDVTITGARSGDIGVADQAVITVDGVTVDITLDGVNIDVSATDGACAFEIRNGATVNLTLVGVNKLASGEDRAGLEVSYGNEVIISGTGSLEAVGGDYGTGIGSGFVNDTVGTITIGGDVTIEATGGDGSAAGIGGTDDGGIIFIGGNARVTARGGEGAGIGGGYLGNGGEITISGNADVKAYGGGYGAGIGGGYKGEGGKITITGGTVYAEGGNHYGAGIGGGGILSGTGVSGGEITISGGTVEARGSDYAAGIGGGTDGPGGKIIINGTAQVVAYGGEGGAGIGGGVSGEGGEITIGGSANVEAYGGDGYSGGVGIGGGAGIGSGGGYTGVNSGDAGAPGNITINDYAFVTATGGAGNGAGNGAKIGTGGHGYGADGSSGGSGIETDPYMIYYADQLRALATEVNAGDDMSGKFFKLGADIDVSSVEWTPIGDTYVGSSNYRFFCGTFDGAGHSITGMSIMLANAGSDSYLGLFGNLIGAEISNLHVQGSIVVDSSASQIIFAGGLGGYAFNSTLTNCLSEVKVEVKNNFATYAGGLVGSVVGSSNVSGCCATGDVGATYTGNSDIYIYAGGLLGYKGNVSSISGCYATGNVSATSQNNNKGYLHAGGLVGQINAGIVSNSYAVGTATVTGGNLSGSYAGSFVGDHSGTITDCFFLGSGNGVGFDNGDAGAPTGLSMAQMAAPGALNTYGAMKNLNPLGGFTQKPNSGTTYYRPEIDFPTAGAKMQAASQASAAVTITQPTLTFAAQGGVDLSSFTDLVFKTNAPTLLAGYDFIAVRFENSPSSGNTIPATPQHIEYDSATGELTIFAAAFIEHQAQAALNPGAPPYPLTAGTYTVEIYFGDPSTGYYFFTYPCTFALTNTPAPPSGGDSGGSTTYTVTFETNGGSAVAKQTVSSGGVAKKPTDPTRGGYTFTGWYADKALSQPFDFKTKITKNITLYADWSENLAPSGPFTDVKPGDWFHGDVQFVYDAGLMTGTGDGKFSPYLSLTRGMIVTILYRHAGQPDVSGLTNPFTDVVEGKYYTDAVKWGVENGVIFGYGDGTFRPENIVSRQELAAMLWRYAQYTGMDVSMGEDTNILSYNDVFDVAEYAIPAMQWACGAGIITGKPGGLLDPRGPATRAETAAMLHRLLEAEAK